METDIIARAQQIADEILLMTRALKLTGQPDLAEQEVDAFSLMLEKREPLINELTELRRLAEGLSPDLRKKLNKTLSEIIAQEKEHIFVMQHINTSVKSSIKEVRSGQKLNQAYTYPMEDGIIGSFDAKQ